VTGSPRLTLDEVVTAWDLWVWGVYPRTAGKPMVAAGAEPRQDQARASVEKVLANDENTAFGIVAGRGGVLETGRRNRSGGVLWMPADPGQGPDTNHETKEDHHAQH
jgi:hypothetical protein